LRMAASAPPPFCANCQVFDWPQPVDPASLLRCSRCKVLQYCGKLCQGEHWEKVHKHHCRYLAKPEKARASLHTADCTPCKEEAALGDSITRPTNPTYPCIDSFCEVDDMPAGLGSPHPFPLAGVPGDREERAIIALIKTLAKIEYTEHPVYLAHQEKLDRLMFSLDGLRSSLWAGRKIWPQGHRKGGVGGRDAAEIQQEIRAIRGNYDARVPGKNKFRLWSLFRLVFDCLTSCGLVQRQLRLRSPLASVAEEHHHLLHRAGESGLLEMVDKVLDMISNKLVPYAEVVKVVCGGSLAKKCTFCGRSVTVREVMTGEIDELVPQVVVHPTNVGLVSCNRHRCAVELGAKLDEDYTWSFAVQGSTNAHMCDHCFQLVPIRAIHRCSTCLTKQYCSQACIQQDAAAGHVVGKFCSTEVEARKVKGSRRERVERGEQRARKGLETTLKVHRAAGAPESLMAVMESFKV